MAIPIWKDTFFNINASASPFSYSIETDGTTVFNGKAWAAPFEDIIKVGVNRVAQDYLHMEFPDLSLVSGSSYTTVTHDEAVRTFTVYDEGHNTVTGYTFRLDWSYKDIPENATTYLAAPINRHGTTGMYFMRSNYYPSSGSVKTRISFNPSVVDIVYRNDVRYTTGYCGNGALYYLNRNCSWDCFLIEGNILRRDDYTRYQMNRSYDNNTLEFGKMTYNNHITPTWELHTNFLKNDESERLAFHLLSSNQVYFHDLVANKIYPVVITDASGEYKTVKNQGNKLVTYTINITASQAQHNIG